MNKSVTGKDIVKNKRLNGGVFSTERLQNEGDLLQIKNANVDVVIDDQDTSSVDLRRAMHAVHSSYDNSNLSSWNNFINQTRFTSDIHMDSMPQLHLKSKGVNQSRVFGSNADNISRFQSVDL